MPTTLAKSWFVTCFHGAPKEGCSWMYSERVWADW